MLRGSRPRVGRNVRRIVLLGVLAALGVGISAYVASAHTITVDGSSADWLSRQPAQDNTAIVARSSSDQGEYIWRDASGDEVGSPDPSVDLRQVRYTATATALNVLVKLGATSSTGAGAQQVQIAIDENRVPGSGTAAFVGNADTSVANTARWEKLIQTRFGSGNTNLAVYTSGNATPLFTGSAAQGAVDGSIELSVPWADLGLSGPPSTPLRFTVASFKANADDTTQDIAGSNARDVVTDYGAPGTTHTTTDETGDGTVDYFADVWFNGSGDVYAPLVVHRFLAAPSPSNGAEYVDVRNVTGDPLDLSSFKLGNEPTAGGAQGMYKFPSGTTLAAGASLRVATKATDYKAKFGTNPDAEFTASDASVPDMVPFTTWSSGTTTLGDAGDELVTLGADNTIEDVVPYGTGSYSGVTPHSAPAADQILQRNGLSHDTDDASADFNTAPAPCTSGPAPTKTWTGGGGDASWQNANNWFPVGVPTGSDNVCIPDQTPDITITFPGGGTNNVLSVQSAEAIQVNSGTVFNITSLTDASTIRTLNLTGGVLGGSGNITVTSAFNWTGGTLAGAGTLTVPSTAQLTISGGAGKGLSQRKLVDNSATTTDWTGGGICVDTGAEWDNNSVLLIDGDQDVSNCGGVASSIVNAGTITKSAGNASVDATFVDIPFSNAGTVNANAGDLRFRADGTDTGSYTVASGALLKFEGGTRTLQASSSVSGLGTVALTGTNVHENGSFNVATTAVSGATSDFNGATTLGTYTQTGGTVSLNAGTSPATLNLGGGILSGGGNMTIAGAFNWTGGTLAGSSSGVPTTTVPSGATLTMSGNGKGLSHRKLVDNSSTSTDWTGGGVCIDTSAEWDNNSVLLIDGDQDISNCGGPASSFVNTGTLTKSAGNSAADASVVDIPSSNSGTVNANAGDLRFRADGTDTGSYTVASGALLKFEGGTRTLQASSSVSGLGTVALTGTNVHENGTFSAAGLTVAGATSDFNGPTTVTTYNQAGGTLFLNSATTPTTVNLSGGTAAGSGNMAIAGGGAFNWTGGALAGVATTTIPASAVFTMSGGSGKGWTQRKLVDNSTTSTDWTGGGVCLDTGAEWDNNSTLLIDGDQDVSNCGGTAPSLVNTGTLTKTAGAGDATFIDTLFTNNGAVNANVGDLRFRNSGTDNGSYTVASGATLKFEGGIRNLQASSSVGGAGLLAFTSGVTNVGGTYNVTGTTGIFGGTAAFNNASPDATSATVSESGGDLNGTGGFDVTGTMTWSGGTMSNTGSTNILSGATLKLVGGGRTLQSGRTLDNSGTVEWDENVWNIGGGTPNGATFVNEPSGLFKIQSNQTIGDNGAGVIQNLGTIEKFGTPSGGWIANYGGEDGAGATDNTSSLALPSWTKGGTVANFTAVQYGTSGFPTAADSTAIGGGTNFFAGGPNTPQSKAAQDVSLSSIAGSVDAGVITANLDAFIGGKGSEGDNGTITADFLDGSGNSLASPIQLGPVTAADRGNVTKLLPRSGNAAVPAGTRTIRVTMTANRVGTGYDDAYFDNVRLRLSDGQSVLGASTIQPALENDGTIKSDEATLSLNGGDPSLGSDSGSFVAPAGAAIAFGGGTRSIASAASVSGAGTIEVNGGTTSVAGTYSGIGQTFVSNGTINFNHASDTAKLIQRGGALGGSALFHVTGHGSQWTGGGQFGSGETRIDPAADLAVDGAFKQVGNTRTFRNQGTINWNGGSQIRMGDCNSLSSFRNEGVMLVNFGATFEACGGQVINTGTLTKATGANTFTISAPFDNDGTLNASAGTVTLNGGGVDQSTGAFNVAAGSTLQFAGGDHTLAPASSVSGLGTVLTTAGNAFVGSGTYDLGTTTLQSGNLALNTTGAGDTTPAKTGDFNESGGSLSGGDRLDVSGNLNWTGGTMSGSGETRLLTSGAGTFDGNFKQLANTRTFRNQATINWNGGSQVRLGDCNSLATFRNEGTLLVNFAANFEGCGGQVLNPGTITKAAGANTFTITAAFDNDGTLNANAGTVDLAGGSVDQSTGTFTVPAAGTLQFGNGDETLAPASSVSGLGTVLMTAGNAFVNSGTFDVGATTIQSGNLFLNTTGAGDTTPAKTGAYNQSSGLLAGNDRLDVSGNLTWTGGTMTGAGETRLLASGAGTFDTNFKQLGNTRTFRNQATIDWNGGSQVRLGDCNSAATFRNEGRLNVKFDNLFFEDCGGQVVNTGTIAKTAGTGVSTVTAALDNTGGTLDVETGTLDATALVNYNGATHTLTGGTYLVAGTLRIPSVDIQTNAAKIVLDGAASGIVDRNNPALDGLRDFATNAAAGDFTIKNGRNLFSSGARGPDLTNHGALRGTGTYFENVSSDGTIAPGTSIGTMTINGAFTQLAGGTTEIEVAKLGPSAVAGTDFDRLVVTGAIALDGHLLGKAVGGLTPTTGQSVDVITHGTRTGTFAAVDSSPSPLPGNLYFDARYDPSAVKLFAVPGVSADTSSFPEGDSGSVNRTVTVSLSAPSTEATSVAYQTSDGTATAGSDYTGTSGTLSFAPGETSKTVQVPILGDTLDEPDETFNVNLSSPVNVKNLTPQATQTILDDDNPPSVSIGNVSHAEGNSGATPFTFTVSLSAPSGKAITVDATTADGTATAASGDYASKTQTLTFAPGETQKTFTVDVNGDTTNEANETFLVNLSNPTNVTIGTGQGTGTIVDDDTLTWSIGNQSISEGDSGTKNMTFTVNLNRASGTSQTIHYATSDGTASAGPDYTATSGTLTIPAGQTSGTINVPIVGDTVDETDETFTVTLSSQSEGNIATATATGTILDDDGPTISVGDLTEPEGDSGTHDALVPVTLSAPSVQDVSVDYQTVAGTATAGADYDNVSGTLTIPAGSTTGFIHVPIHGDTVEEANDTVLVNISNAVHGAITRNQGVLTIQNDDGGGGPGSGSTLSINDVTLTEGNSGTTNADFTVTLTPAAAVPVSADFATLDGTATAPSDYAASSGTVLFNPGETTKHILVPVNGDRLAEPDETFLVSLSSANAGLTKGVGTATITNDDHAPVASAQSASLNEDTPKTITLGAADADSDPLTFSIVAGPGHGTLGAVSGNTVTYTPSTNYNGPDSFTFKANDGVNDSNVATVSLTVNPVNDPPTAAANAYTLAEDNTLSIPAPGVLGNDSDVDGDPITAALDSTTTHGALTLHADGSFTYVPNPNFNGSDSFSYHATDGSLSSAPVAVTLTVTPVNDPPVAVDDSATTPQDTAVDVNVLANDTDVDGDTLSLTAVGAASHGTVSVVSGKAHYVPNPGYTGGDSFSYTVSDGHGGTDTGHVSVDVTPSAPVNHAPNATDTAYTFPEDNVQTVTLPATDPDSNPLTYSIVTGPSHGTLGAVSGNHVTYTPSPNFNGSDSFTFKANDGSLDSNVATVSLTVTPVDDAPVAASQSVSTNEDTAKAVVLGATDVEGDPLTFSIVTGPAHGTLSGSGANRTYTPDPNYHGADSFTFKANDGVLDSNLGVVSITVNSVNDPPVAAGASATLLEDTPKTLELAATDVDGDPLTYSIVSGPTHGTLGAVSGNTVTYTPSADYNGPDSFTFKANDGSADSNVATVSLTVTPVNDPPVAVDDSVSTPRDVPADFNVLANDTDVEGDTLSLVSVGGAAHGTVTKNGNQAHYVPNPGYTGGDAFTYVVSDGHGGTATGHVTVSVTPVNHPPVAHDATATVQQGVAEQITLPATDADGDALTFTIVGGPSHGTLGAVSGDKVMYTANSAYSGPDAFTFKANDATVDSNTATVAITVTAGGTSPPPPPPPPPAPQADLSVTLTGTPDTLDTGQLVTYTATVANAGPADATGVTLTDAFPSVMTFVSATSTQGTCAQQPDSPHNVVCAIGALAKGGGTVRVVIQARARGAGTVTNAAQVSGDQADPAPTNNTAVKTTTVQTPSGSPPPPPPPPPASPPPPPGPKTPPNCVVPKLRGQTLKAAKRKATAGHCKVKVTRAYSSKVRRGKVIKQTPKPGKTLKNGGLVKVTISRGPRPRHK